MKWPSLYSPQFRISETFRNLANRSLMTPIRKHAMRIRPLCCCWLTDRCRISQVLNWDTALGRRHQGNSSDLNLWGLSSLGMPLGSGYSRSEIAAPMSGIWYLAHPDIQRSIRISHALSGSPSLRA